jgi:starch synthase (maltosyl-transferring)
LQHGGRAAFLTRLILAATLSSNYGIYGPAYELLEHVARPGSEEYLDSEKYQLRSWDLDRPDGLRHVIMRLNRIRRENVSLHDNRTLRFHPTDNEAILCYSKSSPDGGEVLVMAVSLDPRYKHSGWLDLDWGQLGLERAHGVQVHDLLGDGRYLWHSGRNYVELDPAVMPAQIFRVRRLARSEKQFEYYL